MSTESSVTLTVSGAGGSIVSGFEGARNDERARVGQAFAASHHAGGLEHPGVEQGLEALSRARRRLLHVGVVEQRGG